MPHYSIHLPPARPEGYNLLAELALDLRWSWNHGTDAIWSQLDPVLWDLTHNPWVTLQTVSPEKLHACLNDEAMRQRLQRTSAQMQSRKGPQDAAAILDKVLNDA